MLFLFTTLWPHSGVLNIVIFRCFLEASFGRAFRAHVDDFGSETSGVPFGEHVGHFLGIMFASIFRLPKKVPNERGRSRRPLPSPVATVHTLPLLGLLPLDKPLRVLPAMHRTHWASQSFPEEKRSQTSVVETGAMLLRQDRSCC